MKFKKVSKDEKKKVLDIEGLVYNILDHSLECINKRFVPLRNKCFHLKCQYYKHTRTFSQIVNIEKNIWKTVDSLNLFFV